MTMAMATRVPVHVNAVAYYHQPDVRARMLEFVGATGTAPPTAAYLVSLEAPGRVPLTWDVCPRTVPSQIASVLARGADVARSLWDTEQLLFFFDLDYLNSNDPAEPFVHPADVFQKLETAYQATERIFSAAELRARAFVSGRGYHFVGAIPLGDPLVDALAGLRREPPPWYASRLNRRPPGVTAELPERQARAAEGLGLTLEYAAHLVAAEASASPIPVVFNGTVVGRGGNGRECVSIDFSHAGDPLDVRHMRSAFSTYQWHRLRPDIFGAIANRVSPLVVVPRRRGDPVPTLLSGRDLGAGVEAASATTGSIPTVAHGVATLLQGYVTSSLAAFHRMFYAARLSSDGRPPALKLGDVPPCVGTALARPNDLLLKPEFIQHVVRHLVSRGWNAAQVAALVQQKYESDFGWGDRWRRMDPQTRAEFDVRVFGGLLATGADRLIDFNCVSAQEKDLCPRRGCPYDLRYDRQRLWAMGAT
jgi:hypothetical protein